MLSLIIGLISQSERVSSRLAVSIYSKNSYCFEGEFSNAC
jgi:hypothetical protein